MILCNIKYFCGVIKLNQGFFMANLFWKTKKYTKNLLSKPFKSEEEFERIIFNTQEILEDIFLIKDK